MERSIVEHLAGLVVARLNSIEARNEHWIASHTEAIHRIEREYLPSGSGIDVGTKVDLDASKGDLLVLHTAFHHMNASGVYDGWTEHAVKVRPAFGGVRVDIGGRDRNQIKDYLSDVLTEALLRKVDF